MQLYAQDDTGKRLFVALAEKGTDYFCIECGERLRVRSGPKRTLHFFHVLPVGQCRLSGKSEQHIRLQEHVRSVIGADACDLEVRFDQIGRIADVAWYSQKIVFEIQCSPISQEELQSRIEDYAKEGWYVIWLLLDTTFFQRRYASLVAHLSGRTFYFVNAENLCVYDAVWRGRERFLVDISTLTVHNGEKVGAGRYVDELFRRPYIARADLLYTALYHPESVICLRALERLQQPEKMGLETFSFFGKLRSFFYMAATLVIEWGLEQRSKK